MSKRNNKTLRPTGSSPQTKAAAIDSAIDAFAAGETVLKQLLQQLPPKPTLVPADLPQTTSLQSHLDKIDNLCDIVPKALADLQLPDTAKFLVESLATLLQSSKFLLQQNVKAIVEESIEEERRLRSVVIANLPESNSSKPTARAEDDRKQVLSILDICNIEALPITVFRMGKSVDSRNSSGRPRPRLLKVELHGKIITRQLLRNKAALKTHDSLKLVTVRESLTVEQRTTRKKMQEECTQKRKDTNEDYIIYRDKITLRSDINKY